MSITILHSNSGGIEEPLKKIDQRTQSINSNTIHEIQNIKKYLASIHNQRISNAILHSLIGENFHQKFISIIVQYYQGLQMKKFLSTIKTKKGVYKSSDLADLSNSKHNEFNGIPIGLNDTIVCVESGILGKSALTIYERFSPQKVICLQSNHESSILAKEFSSLGKKKEIEHITNDGSTFDYGGVDRIYIPNISKNKDQILQQIIRTGKKETRILIQVATGLTQLFYNNYSPSMTRYIGLQNYMKINREYSRRDLHQLYIK